MPEFVLDLGDAHKAFRALDSFTQGYVEAMFFTSTGTGDDAENGLEDADVGELSPEAWERIKADCAKFQAGRPVDLDEACDEARINGYDMASAGRDFWYTRNGHGCGFWEQEGAAWDSLDRFAKSFGNVDLYRGDDGLLYVE